MTSDLSSDSEEFSLDRQEIVKLYAYIPTRVSSSSKSRGMEMTEADTSEDQLLVL